jgi:dTDP-4-dehydrorhamnose reductase
MKHPIRVAVFGSTGMLGHTVAGCLASDELFHVVRCGRKPGCDFHADLLDPDVQVPDVDYVINCAGIIWQAQNPDRREAFHVNSVAPWVLQERCQRKGVKLIQVSTDCVFSGKQGEYTETMTPDETGDYGFSKRLGEPAGAMVLRTSVIGREINTNRSFLGWALANRGKRVNGYTNHMWNGVTSQEYARICGDIMAHELWEPGVHHLYSTSLSKYDLLRKLNDALDLRLEINPVEVPVACDRTMSTVKPLCNLLSIPDIDTMIAGL